MSQGNDPAARAGVPEMPAVLKIPSAPATIRLSTASRARSGLPLRLDKSDRFILVCPFQYLETIFYFHQKADRIKDQIRTSMTCLCPGPSRRKKDLSGEKVSIGSSTLCFSEQSRTLRLTDQLRYPTQIGRASCRERV